MLTLSQVVRRAKRIRLLAMDVDGVLTDGSILVLRSGEEIKFWNVKDRIGFFMLKRSNAPFVTAWISGRRSDQVRTSARELEIKALVQKCPDKGRAFREVLSRFRLSPQEALFIGDDLVDLPPLRMAGLAICPQDAHAEVKRICHYVTRAPGGRGVFREAVDLVLKAQGLWRGVIRTFQDPA
jgi:3-deoxy-D-manno-octulosonate 8-phosphate phosphatase (KDO 8-P phosphatase)